MSTYFRMIKTNNQRMLYLHCLLWLEKAHYLSSIYEQLQLNAKYAMDMVKFIDKIIYCSILKEGSDVVGDEDLSALGNRIDQDFMLKLE